MSETIGNAQLNTSKVSNSKTTPTTGRKKAPTQHQITIELIHEDIKTLKHQNETYQKTICDLKTIMSDYKEM